MKQKQLQLTNNISTQFIKVPIEKTERLRSMGSPFNEIQSKTFETRLDSSLGSKSPMAKGRKEINTKQESTVYDNLMNYGKAEDTKYMNSLLYGISTTNFDELDDKKDSKFKRLPKIKSNQSSMSPTKKYITQGKSSFLDWVGLKESELSEKQKALCTMSRNGQERVVYDSGKKM